jgi:uncharacterized protein YcbK (DUF882 family)
MKKFLIPGSLVQQGSPFLKWHFYGDAIDFSFPGCFGAFWKDISKNWVGGYCIYSGWIHVDVRGYRQTWSGG